MGPRPACGLGRVRRATGNGGRTALGGSFPDPGRKPQNMPKALSKQDIWRAFVHLTEPCTGTPGTAPADKTQILLCVTHRVQHTGL